MFCLLPPPIWADRGNRLGYGMPSETVQFQTAFFRCLTVVRTACLGRWEINPLSDFRRLWVRMCHQFPVDVFADIDLYGSEFESVKLLLQPRFITVDDFREKNFIGIFLMLEHPPWGRQGSGRLGKGIAFPNRGGTTGCALCAERACGNGMPPEAVAFRRHCDVWVAGPVQVRIS